MNPGAAGNATDTIYGNAHNNTFSGVAGSDTWVGDGL